MKQLEDTKQLENTMPAPALQLGTLAGTKPRDVIAAASDIAAALRDVIERQKLAITIQGRKYVRVEGWITLAALLGVMPREVETRAWDDGSYEAVIELVRLSGEQQVLARASAECGTDEPLWAKRPRYARRSMAQTRAAGKAARLAFSWVMALTGYETTPAEEMDGITISDGHATPTAATLAPATPLASARPAPRSDPEPPPEDDNEPEWFNKPAATSTGTVVHVPQCPAHGDTMALRPGGTSQKTGKEYGPFFSCRENGCREIVGVITESQRRRLFALAKKAACDREVLKRYIRESYGWESTEQITRDVYDDIVAFASRGAA